MSKKQEKPVSIPTPTPSDVEKWISHDLNAAIYFLSILKQHPDVVAKIAAELHSYSKTNPVNDGPNK